MGVRLFLREKLGSVEAVRVEGTSVLPDIDLQQFILVETEDAGFSARPASYFV